MNFSTSQLLILDTHHCISLVKVVSNVLLLNSIMEMPTNNNVDDVANDDSSISRLNNDPNVLRKKVSLM